MVARMIAITSAELRIAVRNRWVTTAALMMIIFSLILALAGSAPTGTLGVDRLTVTVSSLATLSVYLVPLIALLMSYEAFAGERERGTLPLLLTYPVRRQEIVIGKFMAQITVLAICIAAGYGLAVLAICIAGADAPNGLGHLFRLTMSSLALGATFIAIGFCLSIIARRPATAASLAIAVWLILVVLLDIALLGALVADENGVFTKSIFPWLMIASPTDAFRLVTLAPLDPAMVETGIGGVTRSLGPSAALATASLVVWPVLLLAAAGALFRRSEP